MTDLGLDGNNRAQDKISRWLSQRSKMTFDKRDKANEKKILLTGFGPFGCDRNISRMVLEMLAHPGFFPDCISFEDFSQSPDFEGYESVFEKNNDDSCAEVLHRSFSMGSLRLSVRLLSLSVEWDVSAAVIVREIKEFEPDLVLMMGLGGSQTDLRLEGQAINKTSEKPGFSFFGECLGEKNVPASDKVLASGPEIVDLPWNVARLSAIFKEHMPELNSALKSSFEVCGAKDFDPKNSYICNHVSYIVSQYAKGVEIGLAGGAVSFPPYQGRDFGAGFLHYPKSVETTPFSAWHWARLILRFMVGI